MYEDIIVKHAKKFASNGKIASVLNGIHYAAGGTVYVTDRYHLLRIRNAHNFEKPVTLHAKAGIPINGEYPDVEKAISGLKFSNRICFSQRGDLERALMVAKCAAIVASEASGFPSVQMEAVNGVCNLVVETEKIYFKGFFGNTIKTDFSSRKLDGRYLINALEVFASIPHQTTVAVEFGRPFEPILISDTKDIDVIILPLKTA